MRNRAIKKKKLKGIFVVVTTLLIFAQSCKNHNTAKIIAKATKNLALKDKLWAYSFANYQNSLHIGTNPISKTPFIEDEAPIDLTDDTITLNSHFSVRLGPEHTTEYFYVITFQKDSAILEHSIWNKANELIYELKPNQK